MIGDAVVTGGAMLTRSNTRSYKNDASSRGIMLWRCIADDFEQMILVGRHGENERLPTEAEIAARYGVNRHTVRRALAELAARGLVYTAQGSGTYVKADKLNYPIGQRTRFSEIVAAAGHEAEGRLQGHRLEPASPELAERLALPAGEMLDRLEIVRTSDRVPISVATTWVCAKRFPDASKVFRRYRSITKMLEHYGVGGYVRKWTRVTAGFADAVDAARLRLAVQRPVLIVESLDVANGEPILTTRGRFAADRVALTISN